MPTRQTQDVWECVIVGFGFNDPEPDNDLIIKLIEVGERIGLEYMECDELGISYEVTHPIEQTRVITAMRAGAAMLEVSINYIEQRRYDETASEDDVVLWRWIASAAPS